MEEIKLTVEGMHCPSCEILIGDELKELNGVKNIEIDHKSNSVNVKFDQSKTNKHDIIEVIKKEGYKVRK